MRHPTKYHCMVMIPRCSSKIQLDLECSRDHFHLYLQSKVWSQCSIIRMPIIIAQRLLKLAALKTFKMMWCQPFQSLWSHLQYKSWNIANKTMSRQSGQFQYHPTQETVSFFITLVISCNESLKF